MPPADGNLDKPVTVLQTLADENLEAKDSASGPYYLIDSAKIPTIIQTLKNTDSLELSELLNLLMTISVANLRTSSSINVDPNRQQYLIVSNPTTTSIQTLTTENTDKPIGTSTQIINNSDIPITGHGSTIGVKYTNTVSTTNTHSAKFGMKQTITGGIGFLGIASGNFTQEFNEEYTYTNATQNLESKEYSVASQPVDIPNMPPHSSYEVQTILQEINQSGVVTGTSRLSGGYTVRLSGNPEQVMDLSIYKKFKTIQVLYPDLWSALREKGIDLDSNSKEVLYTGGIGFESLKGVKVTADVKNVNTGTITNLPLADVQNDKNVDITQALKSGLETIIKNDTK
ncbi:hypothetical protein CSW12_31285 (plasmid) [Bacillus cereus]|uniref:ETX/MTX2 family pore-forming toxin n=1 Tax=Bacillus cereus TaxID=1396 RepID=UPI000C2D42B4|nr:ETX/MTX2 family pore-forming toxin [Bacillus cereus]AUB67193.1 hypothetical protein CSW12_30610 [Bacillus cereus]AUB67304.1 hypothetical protein CSW12_31285 [Bacillus cereus]